MAKKQEPPSGDMCMLMDSTSVLLARGLWQSPPDAPNMQIRVIDGRPEDVAAAEIVQVVSVRSGEPARLGRVILHRGGLIVLDPLRALGEEVRQNLRMPVDFESFLYPKGGGQVPIRSNDLSCGGISFYTDYPLENGEQTEVVVPLTSGGPLVLQCQILRQRPAEGGNTLYAAKFVEMINDQERLVREAVFHVQLKRKS